MDGTFLLFCGSGLFEESPNIGSSIEPLNKTNHIARFYLTVGNIIFESSQCRSTVTKYNLRAIQDPFFALYVNTKLSVFLRVT